MDKNNQKFLVQYSKIDSPYKDGEDKYMHAVFIQIHDQDGNNIGNYNIKRIESIHIGSEIIICELVSDLLNRWFEQI